jgi:hypothetical protein
MSVVRTTRATSPFPSSSAIFPIAVRFNLATLLYSWQSITSFTGDNTSPHIKLPSGFSGNFTGKFVQNIRFLCCMQNNDASIIVDRNSLPNAFVSASVISAFCVFLILALFSTITHSFGFTLRAAFINRNM